MSARGNFAWVLPPEAPLSSVPERSRQWGRNRRDDHRGATGGGRRQPGMVQNHHTGGLSGPPGPGIFAPAPGPTAANHTTPDAGARPGRRPLRSFLMLPKFFRFLALFTAVLGLASRPAARAAAPGAAPAAAELAPDPAAHYGTLPNGLRYVVRANAEPKGRASLRLVVLAGSFMETESQRGLAHFLEHMAFNGSTHYPAGTLINFFQRMGMNFGGDTNAYTSFDHTVYMLELPDTRPATLAEGFHVLGDYAGGLLLQEKEIDAERGIILSEKRTRDSVEYRASLAEYQFVLAGTRVASRFPIGEEAVIAHAPRGEFVDFYNTWYRPERMAVVAVGDFDAAEVERQIAAAFPALAARAPAREAPALGAVPAADGLRVKFHFEPEAAVTTVSLASVTPYAHEPDTAAKRLAELPRSLAIAMLNRRLAVLAQQESAPFISAQAVAGESFDFFRQAGIDVKCQPAQWPAALAAVEQELRRALWHGFQPAELREAAANFQQVLEQSVRTAPTRRSPEVATDIIGSIVNRSVFTSPAADQALFLPALARVTPEDCVAALREAWSASGRSLFVAGNARIDGDTSAALQAAYAASRAVTVTAPAEKAEAKFAYTDFGPAGRVAKRTHVADLDITQVEFANGVRLNLKPTAFEANRIHLGLRVGTGQLTEPRDQPGLAALAQAIFLPGGLGKHSADELQQILAGRTVSTSFSAGSDAFQLGAATDREDLRLQCQLLAAYLTDPGYRPEALRQAEKGIEEFYNSLDHSVEGPLHREVPRLLASGDPRFGLPAREAMLGRTAAEVRAWLNPQLAQGPLEVALVGDFDLEAAIDAVAATLGALPARAPRPALTAERQVKFPAAAIARDYRVETKIPKGVLALYWPTTDAADIHVVRRLQLLASIFADRLRVKVREEIGGAYSPDAVSVPSDTYTGYGYLRADLTVEPAQAGKIAAVVQDLAADLCEHGVTEEELERAKQPILTMLRESVRTNGYWLGAVLARAQEKPIVLDWCRTRLADNEGISKAELDALAKQYLGAARRGSFVSLPEEKAGPAVSGAP